MPLKMFLTLTLINGKELQLSILHIAAFFASSAETTDVLTTPGVVYQVSDTVEEIKTQMAELV